MNGQTTDAATSQNSSRARLTCEAALPGLSCANHFSISGLADANNATNSPPKTIGMNQTAKPVASAGTLSEPAISRISRNGPNRKSPRKARARSARPSRSGLVPIETARPSASTAMASESALSSSTAGMMPAIRMTTGEQHAPAVWMPHDWRAASIPSAQSETEQAIFQFARYKTASRRAPRGQARWQIWPETDLPGQGERRGSAERSSAFLLYLCACGEEPGFGAERSVIGWSCRERHSLDRLPVCRPDYGQRSCNCWHLLLQDFRNVLQNLCRRLDAAGAAVVRLIRRPGPQEFMVASSDDQSYRHRRALVVRSAVCFRRDQQERSLFDRDARPGKRRAGHHGRCCRHCVDPARMLAQEHRDKASGPAVVPCARLDAGRTYRV